MITMTVKHVVTTCRTLGELIADVGYDPLQQAVTILYDGREFGDGLILWKNRLTPLRGRITEDQYFELTGLPVDDDDAVYHTIH